jgi:AraC-like DNA-binding protein
MPRDALLVDTDPVVAVAPEQGDRRELIAQGAQRGDVLLEWYRYPPGAAVELPRHSHAEYQLNLTLGEPGGVYYRGGYHVAPPGTLSILMPDEPHTPRDPAYRESESRHLTLYVRTPALEGAYFREPILDDAALTHRFARMHATLTGRSPALARDVQLLELLAALGERHAGVVARPPTPAHRAVRIARDYLHDNLSANVSLAELSQVSQLSAYRLSRLFRAALGLPPHAYQLQLRIDHAKRLLLAGRSPSDAGHEAGFFDLSHFTRHFKRHVGVAPGAYAARTYIHTG